VYGTHLYTDFGTYDGTPVPYVGNGIINKKPDGSKRGHCMLIIGYDDTLGTPPNQGAFLIQNSFGPTWGQNGRFWMAYSTFSKLSEGTAQYITEP
jgi:C1A family cysteine protease